MTITKKDRARALRQAVRYTADALPENRLADLAPLFPAWAEGVVYALHDKVQYGGGLYAVVQAHTSQSGWTPDATPALFRTLGITPEAPDAVPDWVQPTGAQDAYQIGDKVRYNTLVYQSTVSNNVYAPGVVAGQWKAL